ncbi:MAG: TIGR01458 family HAD-type hydrolase [Calditrichaeota bacterium]|nr:MAG: TIGR01458 family HAD-type hydrolase [Calditrichota bacterium]
MQNIKGVLFDLDGVLFIGDKPIDGAIDTLDYLREKNIKMRFLTNTTTRSFDSLYEKLEKMNLPIQKKELYAPPKIAAQFLKSEGNPTIYPVLEDATKPEFDEFKIDEKNPDWIVIGHYGEKWDYDLMQSLFDKVMNGSKILALHKGKYWQTDRGLTLDIGAFVVGLEHATGAKAFVVGKPESTFFEVAFKSMNLNKDEVIMVGDDLTNDIFGAQNFGLNAFLVQTGKYREDLVLGSEIKPYKIIASVADLKTLL